MAYGWILIGMMGAGKSSVGKGLAETAARQFVDTDALIEGRLGRRVSDIFKVYTEDAFRDHEASVLRTLEPGPIVVATGGGIVLRQANWTEMRRIGTTVFLDVPFNVLAERLRVSRRKRPLLALEAWEDRLREIYEARRPLYAQADIQLDVAGLNLRQCQDLALEHLQAFERDRVPR